MLINETSIDTGDYKELVNNNQFYGIMPKKKL